MADDTAIQQIKIPITETKHRLKKKLNTAMPTTLMPPPPPTPTPASLNPTALIRSHPRGTGKWPLNSGWSLIRHEPLENLWGEGGGGSTKKIFPQGNIKWKKIHVR